MTVTAVPTTLAAAAASRRARSRRRGGQPDGHHVVHDPAPGHVIEVPAGSRLQLVFARRGLGLSQWRVETRPGHLVSLSEDSHDFCFLVFDTHADHPEPLRLVRYRPDGEDTVSDVRDILVLAPAN